MRFEEFKKKMKIFLFLISLAAVTVASPLATEDVIGNTTVDLDTTQCLKFECNMGNFIAESMRYSFFVERPEGGAGTEGFIVLMPGNRMHRSVEKNSDITEGLLAEILPHRDDLFVKTVTGSTVKQALEYSVER